MSIQPKQTQSAKRGTLPYTSNRHTRKKSAEAVQVVTTEETRSKVSTVQNKPIASKSLQTEDIREFKNEYTNEEVALFEVNCLRFHNEYRAKHGSPPLKLNKKLTAYAREWAENLANRNAMAHRPDGEFGENIYMVEHQNVVPERPVEAWYEEIVNYDFNAGKFSNETGHFTQLVWKGSTEVGIAVVKRGYRIWVVANYNPPGNVQGLFKRNVVSAS